MCRNILLLALPYLLFLFCNRQTDGFARHKIFSHLPSKAEWETGQCEENEALEQPYYYLGYGAQTYAFVSKDGNYVLKFFRHARASHPFKFLAPYLPATLKERLHTTLGKRERKRLKTFQSYLLAYKLFREEAGLLYLHLNKNSNLSRTITLYDKIGIQHILEADSIEFILQRKADLVYPTLQKWIEKEEWHEATAGLSSLVHLLKTRLERGIYDKDPDLSTNFGFIGSKAVQIDVGRFAEPLTPLSSEELIRVTDRLHLWLKEKAPPLAQHLQEEVSQCL